MSTDAYQAMIEEPAVKTEDAEEGEPDTGALEEAETNAFLKKYGIKAVSCDEIRAALNVDQLFDYLKLREAGILSDAFVWLVKL